MKVVGTKNISDQVPQSISQIAFDKNNGRPLAQACDEQVVYPAVNDGLALEYECSTVVVEKKKKKSWFEKLFGK